MHHYATVTCFSLSYLPFEQRTWQESVPKEAQSYDFLMHSLLSIAASQLMHARTPRYLLYEQASRDHQRLALIASKPYLDKVTPSNCNALFALSSLVAIISLKFPYPSVTGSMSSPVDETIDFFRLLRGSQTVLQSASEWLLPGWLAPLIHYNWHPKLVPLPPDLQAAFTELDMKIKAVIENDKERNTYKLALRELETKFRSYDVLEDEPALVFAWPAVVDDSFMTALKRHEPLAIVILAYYSVLLQSADHQWWAAGRGRQLMEAIPLVLPSEWLPLIQWPCDATKSPWRVASRHNERLKH